VIRVLPALLLAWSLPAAAERCRALDGDTLQCGLERVRLYAVYAAEMNEAGGADAKRNLQGWVRGREVELRRYGLDRYGRTLADLYVDGRRIEQADIGPRTGRGTRSNYASQPR
jgi:micrococcal nuclease